MSRSILFLIALIALPVALIAFVLSGRRPRREEEQAPVPAPAPVPPIQPEAPASAAPPAPEVASRLHELAFGVPPRPPSDEPAHREVVAAVDLLLSGPVLKPEYAPRRPLHLPKLVQAVNDENVSRRELAVLIAQDPALAGNLLRLANSAFYRVNSQPVESIDRAVTLLGTSGIRLLVAAALLQPVFRTASGEFRRFPDITWEHTQYAASAAEAYAAILADEDPFAAQLLVLLYGLGTILVFRAAMDEYARHGVPADAAAVAALIEAYAAHVASRVAHDWELSSRILTALEDQSDYMRSGNATALGKSLRFGRCCGAVAVLRHAELVDDDGGKAALAASGFGGPDCERIWARLAKQVAAQGPPGKA
ncbi:MAG TPA: HDOD domain-containing protein [Steroidobacteraceae bacterium]|nr:HDOD domain-containing protein [Steroidobacteraceae bacterium]